MTKRLSIALTLAALTIFPAHLQAHGLSAPWLEPATWQQGIHLDLHYPRLVRRPAPFDMVVILRNMNHESAVTVDSIDLTLSTRRGPRATPVSRPLPSLAAPRRQYFGAIAALQATEAQHNRDGIAPLLDQARQALRELMTGALPHRLHIDARDLPTRFGAKLQATVEVHLTIDGRPTTLRRTVEIPVEPPLPDGTEPAAAHRFSRATGVLQSTTAATPRAPADAPARWLAGDQHVHTTYSIDARVLDGTQENVTDYAAAAELLGLDWFIITDHSNVHASWGGTDYYTPEQFAEGTAQAAAYTQTHDFLALYGQEMGVGAYGFWNLPAHFLAYPYDGVSTGYIDNPSSGLIFNYANCESEQTIIDRLRSLGGFGFIAHPFGSMSLAFAEWSFASGATGWAGLEIWSDADGVIKPQDDQAYAKWHQLLAQVHAPRRGLLDSRPSYPNAFPVGLGNSDAHVPGLIGSTFTYAWMPTDSFPPCQGGARGGVAIAQCVTAALMDGQCVASNGPLLWADVNGYRTGQVAMLLRADNELTVHLTTTPSMGPTGDYAITVFVDGVMHTIVPAGGSPEQAIAVTIHDLNLEPPARFITVRADSIDGRFHALANPIWLQFTTPGDLTGDGAVTELDIPDLVTTLLDPAAATPYAQFAADVNTDHHLDGADIHAFLTHLQH